MGNRPSTCRSFKECGLRAVQDDEECLRCSYFEAQNDFTYNILTFPSEIVSPNRPKRLKKLCMWPKEEQDD